MPRSLTHTELKLSVANARGEIVKDMIQEQSVNIIVGDSGLGKSPLLLQMALAVAHGIPFLQLKTRPCRVLYVDYENSRIDLDGILDSLCEHLGIPTTSESLRFLHYPDNKRILEMEIESFRPELILVDALRGLDPKAESKTEHAVACIDWARRQAEKYNTSFFILHHTRKANQNPNYEPPKLSNLSSPVMDWLQEASGSRSLVNQSEARFGIEAYNVGDASLLMRGHFKLRGEVGPWQIRRVYDTYGIPIGYERLTGTAMLSQADRERYARFPKPAPDGFTWQEVEKAAEMKSGKGLARLLSLCQAASLISKTGIRKTTRYHYL